MVAKVLNAAAWTYVAATLTSVHDAALLSRSSSACSAADAGGRSSQPIAATHRLFR